MNKKLNINLVKLVSLLSDGEYHDGTTIGETLHMTRSAVWKAIKKLEQYNIKLNSIKGKGYALLEPLTLLNSQQIKKNITRRDVQLHVFESLDSTNHFLKTIKHHHSIAICLAEQQTQGKGRFNREWHSPFAKNIYLSCLYPFQKDVSELSGLSLVMSLAVVKTLKYFGVDKNLFVKWPNDIVCDHQKISGSLIEIQAETHGACHAIIGVGVNVNMLADEGKHITQAWTSMQQVLKKYVDRNQVCVHLLNNMFDYLQRFEAVGLSSFVDEWNKADCLTNQWTAVTMLHEVIEGRVQGINAQGHLLMELKNGSVRAFSSGDASIVKR
jgi:BirA family biotin operon repressor/biotin-[acetyl-CoA-carboxylase] ligase